MSTHGSNNGNGPSLDKGLEDVGRAYGRLEQEQPPQPLDQAVLNKARREVEARPRWTQFGWLHGLTTAAVVVLAFSIVLNQREPVPVEGDIELDRSDVMLRTAPVAEVTGQESTAAGRVEGRALQKAASPPAKEAPDMGTDAPMEVIGSPPRREAQKSAGAPALEPPEMEVAAEEGIEPEQVIREDASFMAVSAAADAAEPVASPSERMEKDEVRGHLANEDAEQRLAEILRLKRAGDASWQAALEAFAEDYPDYPLPAELSD
jgi:hypothetical protein